jgi:hypothetical protein
MSAVAQAISAKFKVIESAVIRVEEWKNGARFVSKKGYGHV